MSTRTGIYYWKCDRPAAFHGTDGAIASGESSLIEQLEHALRARFGDKSICVVPAGGQGNHRTYLAEIASTPAFLRVEDGPEHDDYFDVEAVILDEIPARQIPAPQHLGSDTSRATTPFAWQALERIDAPDLNQHLKAGTLSLERTAEKIGTLLARWQAITPGGFGPLDAGSARRTGALQGLHPDYLAYFHLNLERHLGFLTDREFLNPEETREIRAEVEAHGALLNLDIGCLVHKDLALWNILGTPADILAVIDWDDAISGDPLDDLSLLACFHGGKVIQRALQGYAAVKPLPPEYRRRFWLHLLRNMLVKAVIRLGAGYFDRKADFFLIGPGANGQDLRSFTLQRIREAINGLRNDIDPGHL